MIIYRLQLRMLATRGRLLALGALGLLGIALAFTVRNSGDADNNAFRLISSYGLAGLVPITTLVIAAASLGDLAEDATLVHFWLRPVPRWKIAVASWLAALTLCVPLSVVPMTVAAFVCGVGTKFVLGTFLASLLGAFAYAALFVGFGLRVQRALAWGLAYVLIWEGAIASAGAGLSRVAVRGYTRSILRTFSNGDISVKHAVSRPVALVVLILVTAVGLVFATRRLQRTDVA